VDTTYEDTLRVGETLSQLLARARVAEDDARALLARLAEHHDPRRLRAGSVVSFRRSLDDGEVRRMDFHLDRDRTLHLVRDDADAATVSAEERIRLVDLLADRIFAWQIDFSRDIRTGDEFRVVYERLVRPDGTARSLRVLGAQFNVDSRDYEAYAFTLADGTE